MGRDARRVQLVDLAPTISHVIGRPFRDRVDGRAIVLDDSSASEPSTSESSTREPLVLAELYTDPREPEDVFHGYRAAIYDDRLKLVVRSDGQAQLFREQDGLESPVPTPPELQEWVDEQVAFVLERYHVLETAAKSRQSEVELDPEVEAGLEALGYI